MPENIAHESAPKPRKPAGGMPYIMPDGRPLSAFLTETNLMKSAPRRNGNRRGRGYKEPASGWTSSHAKSSLAASQHNLTEAETAELAALDKVGQRRQRRWLNDRLLRDMAPALTAKEMESLFKPAPFGETDYVSPFTLAAAPEHCALWDLFRTVDADKQQRVLNKWEEHVHELRHAHSEGSHGEPSPAVHAAAAALRGWAAVGLKGRKALRRAPLGCVEELEGAILGFLGSLEAGELVLALDDGYQRLLAHAIAEFHSLQSFSRDGAGEGSVKRREVVVRRRRPGAGAQQEAAAAEGMRISCADVLWLLEEGEVANVSLQTLQDNLLRPEASPKAPVAAVACA